jgi:hypothetical protein
MRLLAGLASVSDLPYPLATGTAEA